MTVMANPYRPSTPDDVVGKVLRRAEVAKMARKLQDRLALASYKTQHGQERLTFKDVEARLETTIKRKRPSSSMDFPAAIASSPIKSRLFSADDLPRDSSMFPSAILQESRKSNKRARTHTMAPPLFEASRGSWKSTYNLPQSSPVYHHSFNFDDNNHHKAINTQSFTSDAATVPDSPPFGHMPSSSDSEDHDGGNNPLTSFAFSSSPPRTPPPSRPIKHKSFTSHSKINNPHSDDGADLLLYLATSPSPAHPTHFRSTTRLLAPSTPPSNPHAQLPSSMLSTPGGGNGTGMNLAGFNTPGQTAFNFADFCNVTPSPAQGAFAASSRTPGGNLPKTPLAAKEARRRLNFDNLVPPSSAGALSPNLSNIGRGPSARDAGLGMELGGELVSSQ